MTAIQGIFNGWYPGRSGIRRGIRVQPTRPFRGRERIVETVLSKRLIAKVIGVCLLILIGSYFILFFMIKGIVEQETKDHLVQQARAITVQSEAIRRYISKMVADEVFDPSLLTEAQKYLQRKNTQSKEEIIKVARLTRYYRTIPIVSTWSIGQGISHDALYEFRVVRVGARNPKHEADTVERRMLEKIDREALDEYWQIDDKIDALRYMRPIVLKKECLLCHGSQKDYPQGRGRDPLGIEMEGWSEGEQHGAFEIISDLKPMREAVRKVQRDMIGIGILMIVLMIFTIPIWFHTIRSQRG